MVTHLTVIGVDNFKQIGVQHSVKGVVRGLGRKLLMHVTEPAPDPLNGLSRDETVLVRPHLLVPVAAEDPRGTYSVR